jgi:hypothetical protein
LGVGELPVFGAGESMDVPPDSLIWRESSTRSGEVRGDVCGDAGRTDAGRDGGVRSRPRVRRLIDDANDRLGDGSLRGPD